MGLGEVLITPSCTLLIHSLKWSIYMILILLLVKYVIDAFSQKYHRKQVCPMGLRLIVKVLSGMDIGRVPSHSL